MAAIAVSGASLGKEPVKPLTRFESFMLPVLRLITDHDTLDRRIRLTEQIKADAAAEAVAKKEVFADIYLYTKIIQTTWARLGNYHRPSGVMDGPERRQRAGRLQLVEFDWRGGDVFQIYFRIKTRKPGMFGAANALPSGVRLLDLIAPDTLEELSHACHRRVEAIVGDYRYGAWLVLYRLKGMDGLPNEVPFQSIIGKYPADISRCPLILGVGMHKVVQIVDLDSFPHILLGGTTGGGKSTMINSFICQIIRYHSAQEVRLYLVDLKRLEFVAYQHIPHLEQLCVDPAETLQMLDKLIDEIGRRTKLLSGRARSISDWNHRKPDKALPRLIVIIDEFAELMLASGNKVKEATETRITRIINLGRAVGIHLIICTQRPAVQVVSNALKINMPLIISAPVQSIAQSSVILDDDAAAKLPTEIKGRMIYRAGTNGGQIQAPHATDHDVIISVKLAAGLHAGVIEIDPVSQEAAILSDELGAWVLANCNGALTRDTGKRVKAFCIRPKQFSQWREKMITTGKAEKRGKAWYLTYAKVIKPNTECKALMVIPQPPTEDEIKIAKGLAWYQARKKAAS